MKKFRRNPTIDAARGLAVFGMMAPNMINVLEGTAPFPLRFYGSFAAPFFVMLAGMMVTLTSQAKGYRYPHFLKRAAMLLATGAFVDIFINHYIPFTAVDILYLVGMSLPILAAFRNASPRVVAICAAVIFALTPFLQQHLGYTDYPNEYYLNGQRTFTPISASPIWHHWIVDGWFPLFPWLGMGFVGLLIGTLRRKSESFFSRPALLGIATTLFIVGVGSWWVSPPPAWIRGDYSEIFYPPRLSHLMITIATLLSILFVAERTPGFFLWRALRPLGEASLFFYVLHLAVIAYAIRPVFHALPLDRFLPLSFGFSMVLIAIAFGLRAYKQQRRKPLAYGWRFILGG